MFSLYLFDAIDLLIFIEQPAMLRPVFYDELSRFPPGSKGAVAVIEMLQRLCELVLSTICQNRFHFLIAELSF